MRWPPFALLAKPPDTNKKEKAMPTYRMVYGDDGQVVRETYNDVELEREDGWHVFFRGNHAILRVRDEHVQSIEQVDAAT
jgi:hypothetical protein